MADLTPPSTKNTDQVQLLVNDKIYEGWLSFSIVRSLEAPSGSFNLTVSDRWPGQGEPWPIQEGDECQLNLGGEALIVGYVDSVKYALSGQERSLTVSGRDKAGDLIDCSYVEKPDQWKGAKVSEIAADLAKPFGVKVTMEGEDGKVENFKVEPGEKAFDALKRLLKLKGLFAWPDGQGGVTIGSRQFESMKVTLLQTHCISIDASREAQDRFSDYIVKGQRPTVKAGGDTAQGKAASQVKDEAKDPDVKRYRPLMVVSDGAGAEAKERALWEAAVRAGKATKVEAVIQGYRPFPDRPIWALGKTLVLKAPAIGLEAELVISQVKFDLADNSGHTTTLSLTRTDAFLPEPVKQGQAKGGAGGGLPAGTVIYS
jgi:prophage tail gpP-like protein